MEQPTGSDIFLTFFETKEVNCKYTGTQKNILMVIDF